MKTKGELTCFEVFTVDFHLLPISIKHPTLLSPVRNTIELVLNHLSPVTGLTLGRKVEVNPNILFADLVQQSQGEGSEKDSRVLHHHYWLASIQQEDQH